MYEQFRNEVASYLTTMEPLQLRLIMHAIDRAAIHFEFSKKETALALPSEEIPESVKYYLVCKKIEGLSEHTLKSYQTTLSLFFREVRKQPGQVQPNDIRLYLYNYQKVRAVSNRTLDKYREYICRFFVWANDEGYISTNPARTISPINYEVKPRDALNQIELEYLRQACQTSRDKAIVEFLYSTGCRVSELADVKLSDIDWREKSVHLIGKGQKHRVSFLNAKAEVALKNYLDTRSDECPFVFVSMRKPHKQLHRGGVEKILREIGNNMQNATTKHITPHVLRHTTATTALQSGMAITDIQKLLGHSSVETTMIYAKSSVADVQNGHRKHIV